MTKRICYVLLCFNLLFIATGCNKESKNELASFHEYSDFDILKEIINNLKKHDYYIESSGVTKAKLGLIGYTQNTSTSLYYQNNEFYNIINSTSSLVSHYHRLYVCGNQVKYMDSDKSKLGLIEASIDEYLLEYGKVPSHETIFNYVITSDTITSSSRNFQNNSYQITFNLDPVKGAQDTTKQMKVFGNLVMEPKFKSIALTIYFDEHFNLLQYKSIEDYVIVKKIITDTQMECHQELTSVVYLTNYNKPKLTDFFS